MTLIARIVASFATIRPKLNTKTGQLYNRDEPLDPTILSLEHLKGFFVSIMILFCWCKLLRTYIMLQMPALRSQAEDYVAHIKQQVHEWLQ